MVKKYFERYFLNTYNRYNVIFVKGNNQYLFDEKGKKYLDFFCGLAVTNLGHINHILLKALKRQASSLWHCSNLYYSYPQLKLAKELIKLTFPSKVFFSNSGAEANECAIKLVRKYGSLYDKYEIITFKNSFHGRTLATLSATGQEKFHKGFEPLVDGFKYAEFNNIFSVKKLINKKTIAIMIEPIQGEGGINVADVNFLKQLRDICDENGLILIFDEIQTGFGRTGEMFAFNYYGVKPDIITLAKGISNGLPLGATLVDIKYSKVFNYGDHGSTFGGNLISCAVACEVLKQIDKKLLNNVKIIGKYLLEKLNQLKSKYNFIKSVRGVGLMLGMELTFPAREVVELCLKKGLVLNVVQEKVIRFLPPLIIKKVDVDYAIDILDYVFKRYDRRN
ncbi:MAG: aspartate aminotransferase family protein [Elusimicrobiota bacterium]|nr:aspartate aminotransferase family protein [Endomicrobiia bacterium]MDW8165285.1 aspartate aminotransferase family protein [Elusimicrobiota bacterium]